MAALTISYWPPLRWAALACLAATLLACSTHQPPQPLLTERCLPVSAAAPITLQLPLAPAGAVRIAVWQRGISLTAALTGGTAVAETISPVDRYGAMTFLPESRQASAYTLRVASRDSSDIVGEACISAQLLDASDPERINAERPFADAGRATRAHRWQDAFAGYLAAARGFDHLDPYRAAEARQAMASLAYLQLDRSRDGYALAERALEDFGAKADPGMRSALIQIQTAIIAESKPLRPDTRRERALHLLDVATALASQARFGARELARLMLLRGFVEYATGGSRAGSDLFARAAAQCHALHDWECYARARNNMAQIAEETAADAAAQQDYTDALQILSPAVAPGQAADLWDNLGRVQSHMGLFSSGEQSQLNALRLYSQIDNCDGVRRVLSTLGSILVQVGNVDDALVYLNLATAHECAALLASAKHETQHDFQTSRQPAEPRLAPEAGGRIAASAACMDPPAPATLSADGETSVFRALLAQSFAAALEVDSPSTQRCLAAARAFAATPRSKLRLANATGLAYLQGADAVRARESFMQALAIADQASLAAAHPNRGPAYSGLARAALLEQQSAAARDYSMRALRLSISRADVVQAVDALQVLAMSLRALGERAQAEQTLGAAANLIEQVPIDGLDAETRATYLATQHGVFEELTDVLAANDPAAANASAGAAAWAALAAAERGRARSWQYAISQATGNEGVQARSATRYQELAASLATLGAAAGSSGSNAIVQQLESVFRGGQAFAAVTPGELLPQLARLNATLVEFATGHDDMFAFVIDAGVIHAVPLGSRKRISAAAADLSQWLRDPEGAARDGEHAARQLAQLVLWPVTPYVTQQRVIFVPDDALHMIPFAVLPWSQDPAASLVLQHGESAIVPSALFVMQPEVRRTHPGAPRFELIGDPIFQEAAWRRDCAARDGAPVTAALRAAPDWTDSLPRLPGSRTEVLAIADLARAAWPTSHVGVHLGCEATPRALREAASSGADLLHVATHGYVDAARPRLSALALTRESATRSDSGVFGLLEILAAHVSARLVVLSACDTSAGRLLPGEGVLGPAQAFLQSGAGAVIASYWRIDDAATAAFMRTFYKYLLTERLPVAAALRRAQLEHAVSSGAHAWAGFALFGWPDGALQNIDK
jgi:CHAT domain-containing protein